MRVAVIVSHPDDAGLIKRCADTAVDALQRRGHEVTVLDLHEMRFQPAMSAAEHVAYHTDSPIVDPLVAQSAEAVRTADMLVFVYPTRCSSLPAMLKGWLEKTMV